MNAHPLILLLSLTGLFFTHLSLADDTLPQFNQVTFSVTQSQQVENDLVSVRFSAHAEEKTAQAVQHEINQKMHQAQRALNRYSDITISTQDYRVGPVYDEHKKIQHWKGQQMLSLNLKIQPGLADILSKVQPYLHYNDMHFAVSEPLREKTMTSLLKNALAQYQAKAKLIAEAFGQTTFRISRTQVQSATPSHPLRSIHKAYVSSTASQPIPPTVETGNTRLRITVSGQVTIPNQHP